MDDVLDFPTETGSRAISASWVFTVLRSRLGCVAMGWRDQTSWSWVTPNGVEFEVAHPAADTAAFSATGRELQLSRDYALELISRIRELLKR